jgi:hypothetical protein
VLLVHDVGQVIKVFVRYHYSLFGPCQSDIRGC